MGALGRSFISRSAVALVAAATVPFATASAAFAAPPVLRLTGAVSGSVGAAVPDGTCPPDAYFPDYVDPHQHYAASIASDGGTVDLAIDVCISSDAGALGGNTFRGTFTASGAVGVVHGTAIGAETHQFRQVFSMTLQAGNRLNARATETKSPRVLFSGCFTDPGALIDASITSVEDVPQLHCGLP